MTLPYDDSSGDGELEAVDLFSEQVVERDDRTVTLPLEGYGFRWLRVRPAGRLDIP